MNRARDWCTPSRRTRRAGRQGLPIPEATAGGRSDRELAPLSATPRFLTVVEMSRQTGHALGQDPLTPEKQSLVALAVPVAAPALLNEFGSLSIGWPE